MRDYKWRGLNNADDILESARRKKHPELYPEWLDEDFVEDDLDDDWD